MHVPEPVGPLSERVVRALRSGPGGSPGLTLTPSPASDVVADHDVQLALWTLFELHYRSFEDVDPDLEWDGDLIGARSGLEARFEAVLRQRTADAIAAARAGGGPLTEQLVTLIEAAEGPSLAAYLQRDASLGDFTEFMRQRSLYHLRESDPQSFVLPRVDGPVKVALAEIQYDEYGAGRPAALHSTLFARALEGCGLDATYGAYIDGATALTLATNNAMSMFGLRRRLRGAALGHLAAFETTSSVPCRRIAGGAERLDLPPAVAAYFEEHIEADAVHEQVAVHNICGALVEQHPELHEDVLFGAAVCVHLDAVSAEEQIDAWRGDAEPQGLSA